jgi:hypothetical protein
MLRVPPACLIAADELLGHLAEGAAPGDGKPLRLSLSFLCVQRVDPIVALLPVFRRLCARLCE